MKWLITTILLIVLMVSLIVISPPKPALLQDMPFSQAIYDKQQHLLRLTLTKDGKFRLYTPLKAISPLVIEATLLQEDQHFYDHPGINPLALVKAGWHTFVMRNRRIGASTITMQVARMNFNIDSKTLAGKISQILHALQLEIYYSKTDILTAYLNMASYGGNIEGVGAASLIYFDKPAEKLTLPEAMTLVVIPQNPVRRAPKSLLGQIQVMTANSCRLNSNTYDAAYKSLCALILSRDQLFHRWLQKNPADINQQSLFTLPVQTKSIKQMPYLAPHFVDKIVHQEKQPTIITTLNLKLQKIIENITRQYIRQKHNVGINNAAVILVDTRNMEVKALLGSANFFDASIAGQVNGTQAKRSPGSTLKPFIYALALDQGLIHPYTVLKDAPVRFGSYSPENFDNEFTGPIKAKEALDLSRNIPAIYLASKLSHPNLYEFLQQAEITELKPEIYYGLSLVLGGGEITMQELAALYATLANGGMWKPLRMQTTDPINPGKRLLSPEASFLTLDMLKDTARPQMIYAPAIKNNRTPVYWKTGTSSGFRDAWTVGVFGPYVLAVWIGNFDARGNPAFVGKEAAAPLFFAITDAIDTQTGPLHSILPNPQKLNLVQTQVCEASGMLPTRFCINRVNTWFIPGKSPIKTDTVFREVAIDKKTGLRACHFDGDVSFEVYEFWPSDLLKIFQQAGVQRRTPPAYDPGCTLNAKATVGTAPHITSPQASIIYTIDVNNHSETLIPLTAVGDADVKYFYWFINETYIGSSDRDKALLWSAKAGDYKVRVIDDRGRSDRVDVKVRGE